MDSIFLSPPVIIFALFFIMFLPILVNVLRQPKGEDKDRDIAFSLGSLFLMFVGSMLLSNPIGFFEAAFGGGGGLGGVLISMFGLGGAGLNVMYAYFFATNLRSWVRLRTRLIGRGDIFQAQPVPAPEIYAVPPPVMTPVANPIVPNEDVFDQQIRLIAATERAPTPEGFQALRLTEDVVLLGGRRRHRRQSQ